MKNKSKAIGWVALYCVIALGIELILGVLLGIIVAWTGIKNGISIEQTEYMTFINQILSYIQKGAPLMIINGAAQLIMLACFGLWYYFRENKYAFRPNYKKAFSAKNVLCIVGIGFFGQYAIDLVLGAVNMAVPEIFEQYMKLAENFDINTMSPIVMVLIICFLGPLSEELIFRGMIYGRLRRAYSMLPSMIVSALLFGIYHMNWVQGIYATLFGLVLAYIYEKTQTIWGAVLLHVVFNSCSYIISGYETALRGAGILLPDMLYLAIDLVSVAIVFLLLRQFRTKRRKAKVEKIPLMDRMNDENGGQKQ